MTLDKQIYRLKVYVVVGFLLHFIMNVDFVTWPRTSVTSQHIECAEEKKPQCQSGKLQLLPEQVTDPVTVNILSITCASPAPSALEGDHVSVGMGSKV